MPGTLAWTHILAFVSSGGFPAMRTLIKFDLRFPPVILIMESLKQESFALPKSKVAAHKLDAISGPCTLNFAVTRPIWLSRIE
jgi:hypothetical protein